MVEEVIKENLIHRITELVFNLSEKDVFRSTIRGILSDRNKLSEHIPIFKLINEINDKYKTSQDKKRFILEIRRDYLSALEENFENVADFLNGIKFHDKELEFISNLNNYLEENKNNEPVLKKYITNQGSVLVTSLRSFNQINISFIIEEIWYLIKYLQEVILWPRLTETKRIQYFTQRITFYIKGYQNEVSGLDYRGISYFKDKKLMKQILKNYTLKKPLTYARLRDIFTTLLIKARKGIAEKNWGDFEDFWKNRKKYEKLIERLGYEEFFISLKQEVKTISQQPTEWIRQFQKDISLLDNPNYINNKIIIPAAKELGILFENRIQELISELIDRVTRRNKDLHQIGNKGSVKLIRMLNRKKRQLNRKVNLRRFEKKEIKVLGPLTILIERLQLFTKKNDINIHLLNINKWRNHQTKWYDHSQQILESLGNYSSGRINFGSFPTLMSSYNIMANAQENIDIRERKAVGLFLITNDKTQNELVELEKMERNISKKQDSLQDYIKLLPLNWDKVNHEIDQKRKQIIDLIFGENEKTEFRNVA